MICKKCEIQESRTDSSHYCECCYSLVRKEIYKKHYLLNKESRNKLSSEYKLKNKEKIKEYNRKYTQDNYDILSEKRKEKRKF